MAPVEFEKHIKDQLEERKIKPSAESWDKISDRLIVDAGRKKPIYFRFAVAALIAGILLSVVWVYHGTQLTNIEGQPVVDRPENEQAVPVAPESPVLPSPNIVIAEETQNNNSDLPEEDHTETVPDLPELANNNNSSKKTDVPIDTNPDLLIDVKVSEIIAQVNTLEENKEVVTNAEVDSLLRNAHRELLADKDFREGRKVDASGLLAGVEDEIDSSFRDQVFEKLKQGFDKVRTAVADRNK